MLHRISKEEVETVEYLIDGEGHIEGNILLLNCLNMDRRMKKIDYRPSELKTMDPSYRYNMWSWEKRSGHLFADAKRIATFHSSILALAIGGLFGVRIL